MILQGKFKILSNRCLGRGYFKMAILAPGIARQAQAGQFVNVFCNGTAGPLLRRPFSFHRLKKDGFEILYKVVGPGTNLLSKKRKADIIDILGPLGNGFDIEKPETRNQKPEIILVAGGMGVAPLLALAEGLMIAQRKSNIVVLLGAKNKKEILCESDFKKLGAKVQVATDDGSKGHRGFITELLSKILRTTQCEAKRSLPVGDDAVRSEAKPPRRGRRTTIYACGPKAMLQEITQISLKFDVSAYGALEEIMACGLGACLGCAVHTVNGYKLVCKDGPVFNLKEIKRVAQN